MIESEAEPNMFKTKRSRIAGLVVLIVALVLLGLNFAITRSSPSLPANYNSLPNTLVRLYRGDVGFWLTSDVGKTPVPDSSFTHPFSTHHIQPPPRTPLPPLLPPH